ncbi:malonyl-CoA:anthocyanidin 5-O-glucoside-6''-O-malonyltransferase-like [Euphorbia lathyris]|uniref:malonyl-CoA:anthocyanidin 5-O-glucoside-6''-O-malonyltransferase-like n=1 Tax=Euphorbia lathyris TaxID=212925 RepID=UPI003313A9CD
MALSDSPAAVRVTELCKITPPDSPTDSSLPLTFFDIYWLKFHPLELIFFYQLTTDSDSFSSDILPKLKQSLSLTLHHFIPFAGNLIWPSHSDKPFLLYSPGDGVSLTVAESDADFHTLAGDSIREIPDSHNYVPELNVSETEAATMSFQITLFPNQGYCIGISSHHGIFDGKSIIMFIKAWAHICKNDNGSSALPPDLTPVIDRTLIQDHQGLESLYLNRWTSVASLPEAKFLIKEDGLGFVAEELTRLIKGLEKNKGGLDEARKTSEAFRKMDPTTTEVIGVAGSPRFGVYDIDFGWEKPIKVEVTSIDRSTSISMAEIRDGNGGVELGVVLKKDEMVIFDSLFLNGLKHL